jgi:hypothetical protein
MKMNIASTPITPSNQFIQVPPPKPKWWWVEAEKNSGTGAYGPFDTERDAHITARALSIHCDWIEWKVITR